MKKYKVLVIGDRAYAQVGVAFMSIYSPNTTLSNNQMIDAIPMHGSSGPYLRIIEPQVVEDQVVTGKNKGA